MALKTDQLGPNRRSVVKGGMGLLAMTIVPSGLIVGDAWAQMPRSLDPESFAALVQMSRDCYPHDRIEDKYYATAVDILDQAARSAEADLKLLQDGVVKLNAAAREKGGQSYRSLKKEDDRVAVLGTMQDDPFFQKVRSNLVVGLYNQKELWPIFGYEGASADKGGYLDRGFNDISWLA